MLSDDISGQTAADLRRGVEAVAALDEHDGGGSLAAHSL